MFKSKSKFHHVPVGCPTTVVETVCLQADVTIKPDISVGTINTFCVGSPTVEPCCGTLVEECTFSVSQSICVEIPLSFSVDATVEEAGIACGKPGVGACTA